MSQEKPLTGKQEAAAVLVADDTLTNEQIGAQVGVTRRQVDRWKTDARFRARVQEHISEAAKNLQRFAIARKDRRMAAYQDRWHRMRSIIDERAEAERVPKEFGGKSGLMVLDYAQGSGAPVFKFDAGLESALLALEKQASQEAGQWTEKAELTGKDGSPLFDLDKPVTVIYADPDQTNNPA